VRSCPLDPPLPPPFLLLFNVMLWNVSILNKPPNEHTIGKRQLKGEKLLEFHKIWMDVVIPTGC